MRRTDFAYDLPVDLIAQHPPVERAGGRLLHIPRAEPLRDLRFTDFPSLLKPGDLLVFNDTRVIPARVHGVKPTGGQVEILLERVLDGNRILAHVHASKPLRSEAPVALPGGVEARFVTRHDDLFELQLSTEPLAFFQQHGSMPLPPYIERNAELDDATRYQTVYAREPGAVAAPTAGLHFDDEILARCKAKGVESTFVTLHVGAGTFQNVRVDDLQQHRMHAERISVSAEACAAIAATKARGGRVIAVGTTVVRSLESAAQSGSLQPYEGETRLFITPGYRFKVIDALLTNFHLPESTLLMLVCAFGGFDEVMGAYRHAVAQRYRFFSYGDAMFLERR
ncbi:tRNA preQ1(34) S-adenosylmethionine ribosyltransferase-isomerase QueA [Peristeroidobacter agariperforans]|uniref:tRNA preQ1(34) S-adenosylmethionine ribosyltransferase-isomerase QueA n=1 Tax=Peristeroidobacter agariperforans TaxID=268404 RepID=UPI00101DF915|nr:tRNA preQ1(34) S-adenosylmethionine ribosyltransferase-isomerase QueA [Peristeroidobacter agariperforans]